MEKRVNAKIQQSGIDFKKDIKDEIVKQIALHPSATSGFQNVIQYIYDYEQVEITPEDFTKRKRVKNIVPQCDRCCAKRANGDQCSRRKLSSNNFCGTHAKGTPHGVLMINDGPGPTVENVEILIHEINGIYYYLDKNGNVYKPEDIVSNKQYPSIIAKYKVENGIYSIPELKI